MSDTTHAFFSDSPYVIMYRCFTVKYCGSLYLKITSKDINH
jgi:hypothetical protein